MPSYSKADQLKANRKNPKRAARGKFSKETILAIYERDEGRCVKCGTSQDLEAIPHHCRYKSQMGLGIIENGIILCRSCHRLAHTTREMRVWCEEYVDAIYKKEELD